MVIIDENWNKVYVWTESRIDTATLEIMEMKHTRVLALLAFCDIESAERLRDALFEIFPAVDYIEIYE